MDILIGTTGAIIGLLLILWLNRDLIKKRNKK